MKPIVHYVGPAVRYGNSALLHPVDHPNHLDGHDVSNTTVARTSDVVSWEGDRIETKNTIYMPLEVQDACTCAD